MTNLSVRANIEPLNWENQFFGVNSAILRFSDDAPTLDESMLANWSRVQAKIPAQRADQLDALQQLGFRLVEGEVDLRLSVETCRDPAAEIATEKDIPRLRELAAQAFAQSRFRAPWYATEASGRFYAQWVENAVRGTFDNQCLIFRDESSDIRAFVSLRQLDDSEARIGLLAGRGAGEILIQAALCWAQQRGLSALKVATQMGNTAALKRYIHSGAIIDSTAYWLYR
jgi:dTDP-4-amino-4,6-dideoxy-D-galactose acyltransferase